MKLRFWMNTSCRVAPPSKPCNLRRISFGRSWQAPERRAVSSESAMRTPDPHPRFHCEARASAASPGSFFVFSLSLSLLLLLLLVPGNGRRHACRHAHPSLSLSLSRSLSLSLAVCILLSLTDPEDFQTRPGSALATAATQVLVESSCSQRCNLATQLLRSP